jgi:hypothetical protein
MVKIGENSNIGTTIITANNEYIVLGLPFFNVNNRMGELSEPIREWIGGV